MQENENRSIRIGRGQRFVQPFQLGFRKRRIDVVRHFVAQKDEGITGDFTAVINRIGVRVRFEKVDLVLIIARVVRRSVVKIVIADRQMHVSVAD